MLQGRLVKILGYYIDASFIEGIVGTFRKLLIDILWIYGRRINSDGLYEIYVLVNDHPNIKIALLDLSKSVGVEEVEIFEGFDVKEVAYSCLKNGETDENCKNVFVLHIPIYSRVITYRRGEVYGEDIQRSRCISRCSEG